MLPFVSWSACRVCVAAQREDSNQASRPPINTTISERLALRFPQPPPRIRLPPEAPMPFSIRPFRRFPVCCPVTYYAGPFFKLPLASCLGFGSAHCVRFATCQYR